MLPLLGLSRHLSPHSTQEGCRAGAGVESASCQALTRVFKTWLPDCLKMVCRAGVGDGPSQSVFLFARQLEHRMLLGKRQEGLGWPKVAWVLSRR